MSQHEKHHQHPKRRRRNREEINRGDLLGVIMQKCFPRLGWRAPCLRAVFAHGGHRDRQTQFGQFVANARAAPSRIGQPHLADQRDELAIHRWPPVWAARLPTPEHSKPGAVPADHRLRADDHQRLFPTRLHRAQENPQQPIWTAESGPTSVASPHHELVPQRQVLEHEFAARLKRGSDAPQHRKGDVKHGAPQPAGIKLRINEFEPR